MKREPDTHAALVPAADQIELALAHLEGSAAFRTSPRHRALLRHMVERVLRGDIAALKETLIAVQVFGRPVASFDPKLDSIVRVEARRLRARLKGYYREHSAGTPIRIELPVGSYVPLITTHVPLPQQQAATRRARDLVERGEHFLRQSLSKETLEQALLRFDMALRESPGLAAAYVGIGRAWFNLATAWYEEPAIATEHAAEALRTSLELDPGNAVAHALLGAIQHQFEYDWPAAKRSFKRALALAPAQAFVHSAYGWHLVVHGDFKEGERELALARELDPHYINSRNHMVNLRLMQGRIDDAAAEIEAMCDIAPETMPNVTLQAFIALDRGEVEQAVLLYWRGCEVMPDHPGCFIALAGAHAAAGRIGQADALVADTLTRFAERPMSPYLMAIYATRCGRFDEAFELLGRAVAERDPNAMQITSERSFFPMYGDARWAAFSIRPRGRSTAT